VALAFVFLMELLGSAMTHGSQRVPWKPADADLANEASAAPDLQSRVPGVPPRGTGYK